MMGFLWNCRGPWVEWALLGLQALSVRIAKRAGPKVCEAASSWSEAPKLLSFNRSFRVSEIIDLQRLLRCIS